MNHRFSRRAVVGALAASSVMSLDAQAAASSLVDTKLIDLGRQFDQIAKQMDNACDGFGHLSDEHFTELARVEAEILSTPATSTASFRELMYGLCHCCRAPPSCRGAQVGHVRF